MITIDTLRADHLGCYGYEYDTSPTIDRLAKEGTRFALAFAPRGLTWPSLASVMTGLYPVHHGVRDNGVHFDTECPQLGEVLRDHGYDTGAFVAKNIQGQRWEGFRELAFLEDDEITLEGLRWIHAGGTTPFFLWLHYLAPHHPYSPAEAYVRDERKGAIVDHPGISGRTDWITLNRTDLDSREISAVHALYDGEVSYIDRQIERILAGLRRAGLDDSTLVIFAADHGEELYDHHHYFYHGASVYDSVLHVPLAMRWPGRIPMGKVVPDVVELVDVTPTVLESLDLRSPCANDGISLLPYMEGQRSPDRVAFSELEDKILSLRSSEYRLIWNPSGYAPRWISDSKLWDTAGIVPEPTDLVGNATTASGYQLTLPIPRQALLDPNQEPRLQSDRSDEFPEAVEYLVDQADLWREQNRWDFDAMKRTPIDPKIREALEALGYVF